MQTVPRKVRALRDEVAKVEKVGAPLGMIFFFTWNGTAAFLKCIKP